MNSGTHVHQNKLLPSIIASFFWPLVSYWLISHASQWPFVMIVRYGPLLFCHFDIEGLLWSSFRRGVYEPFLFEGPSQWEGFLLAFFLSYFPPVFLVDLASETYWIVYGLVAPITCPNACINRCFGAPLGIVHPLMNITPFEEKEAERSPFLWAGHNSEQNGMLHSRQHRKRSRSNGSLPTKEGRDPSIFLNHQSY